MKRSAVLDWLGKKVRVLYIAIEVLWRKEGTFFKSEEVTICSVVIDLALIPFDFFTQPPVIASVFVYVKEKV